MKTQISVCLSVLARPLDERSRKRMSVSLKILGVKYLDAMCVFFWASTPVMITLLSFVTYCLVYTSSSLTAAKIFTSLALFNMLIGPLNSMPWVSRFSLLCSSKQILLRVTQRGTMDSKRNPEAGQERPRAS